MTEVRVQWLKMFYSEGVFKEIKDYRKQIKGLSSVKVQVDSL